MKGKLFSPTDLQRKILKALAKYEVLTSRDLAILIFGNDQHSSITILNKSLMNLRNQYHMVNRVYFTPEKYKGKGNIPNAWGLSEKGVMFAQNEWPATYPKTFSATHSPHTIEHDLRRARTHIVLADIFETDEYSLGWKKGGYHLVKPDDVFEITKTKTTHFFLEEEYKKKDFAAFYEKFKPYVQLKGSGDIKRGWGFSNYTVIVPMRDADAVSNLLTHFKGFCNCPDPNMKFLHKSAPFTLKTDVLWFTTHEEILKNPTGSIFQASATNKTFSFLDIIK